ncbi:23S rRNA (pseudouridine(1915)-N(3))-methyltransferase RlmH [Candidatus Lariskella endosymbiont of Hedychridium roseum]|uniref:23S rRNA (pseudouridine(1915)-N(3))-methyltransferase RlmH n=1 Tax=Candidatus Lariskella endosymbiont of Hedychridium roseum TaxID=3077949 RepID=UPI0030CE6820
MQYIIKYKFFIYLKGIPVQEIIIYTIGKNNSTAIIGLEDEYIKRIRWKISRVQIDLKIKASSSSQQKLHEGDALLLKVNPDSYLIALDERCATIDILHNLILR